MLLGIAATVWAEEPPSENNINARLSTDQVENQIALDKKANPLEDITVIGGSEKWFDAPDRDGIETMRIIMKDGKIYKNTL